ncbi:MAG: ring-cleaving dioxygenase [Acidobacteria bacterium]|nr:ring-cleaving dioxygenase [Acidobacteriota bacterium]
MSHPIVGLHHVTATSDDAQADLDFCLGVLGLRLVKKTVNFDNHSVYHFYYGTERGAPGTIWTTFPYRGRGVPVGRKGAGQVTATAFSVPAGSLASWTAHLRARGVAADEATPRFGEESLRCTDPSGLRFELIASDSDTRPPWPGGPVGEHAAIRGLHHVTLTVRSPQQTVELLTTLLGCQVVDEAESYVRLAVGERAPGRMLDVRYDPAAEPAMNGLGTVHHVALAITGGDDQARLRRELIQYGCQVTEIRDRCYFTSIYFREPGGVLLEIATVDPGFTVDEDVRDLGRSLKLPPWEEPHRPEIERTLPPVRSTAA